MNDETNVLQPNPLMSALFIPGETFRLPSQGLFYSDDVFDGTVKNGEVEVYPMTAIDEIIISTPDKLLSGKAVTEVFAHCIPQIKKAHSLLAKDVDFLMVCLRMVSYGSTIEVVYTHNCKKATEHTYTADLSTMLRSTKSIDPTTFSQEYSCVLFTGQVVTMKPMTYGEVIKLYQDTLADKTKVPDEVETEKMIINTLVSVIKDVDGIVDQDMIREWARKLPIKGKLQIQNTMRAVSEWGVDMKSIQICTDCKKEVELSVSANPVSFFF